jgi:hypothetical protein
MVLSFMKLSVYTCQDESAFNGMECDICYTSSTSTTTLLMPSLFDIVITTSMTPLLMLSYPCDPLKESEYCLTLIL